MLVTSKPVSVILTASLIILMHVSVIVHVTVPLVHVYICVSAGDGHFAYACTMTVFMHVLMPVSVTVFVPASESVSSCY